MSVTEIVQQLGKLSDADRLVIINAASSLMSSQQLAGKSTNTEREARLIAAATALEDYYEQDEEVRDWQSLDAEEIYDEHIAR